MATLLMNLLGIIALVCAGIVVYGLRMKSIAHRSKVLKIGIVMLCLSCAALGGAHFLGDDANFNTPEEAWKSSYTESISPPQKILAKEQGENLCTFIILDEKNGGCGLYTTVKMNEKWRAMNRRDKDLYGQCNGVDYVITYSEDCEEAAIFVNWHGTANEKLTILDSQNSVFTQRRIENSDGTSYDQYETMLASIDKNYWIEINGKKAKPFSE